MEQLIPVIEFVKKNRFWLTCGVLIIALVVTWYLATGALHKERVVNQGKIDGAKNNGERIISTGADGVDAPIAHPNDKTKVGMDLEIDEAAQSLLKAWRARRAAQEPILKWPEISTKKLKEKFEPMDPPEKFISGLNDLNDLEMDNVLSVYRTEIPNQMGRICDIIGTNWEFADEDAVATKSSNDDRDEGRDEEKGPVGIDVPNTGYSDIVQWNQKNQELWQAKLTQFQGIDGQTDDSGVPTPIQVLALQQDLWLLEAMFNIIKEVNGGADANDLAVVKRIDHVVFGREARSKLGKLTDPDPGLAPSDANVANSGQQIPQEERKRNQFGSRRQTPKGEFDPNPGAGLEQAGPLHGRYVDADFQPITAKTMEEVLTGDKLPDENLELVVAKRVPVRIAVRMDDQKIDDFIAACSNSPFAFEIWQVRVERPLDEIVMAGGGDQEKSEKRKDGQERGEVASMSAGGGNDGGDASEDSRESVPVHLRKTYDVNVEFYGIVKIYNPVDEELILGTKGKTANTVNPNPKP